LSRRCLSIAADIPTGLPHSVEVVTLNDAGMTKEPKQMKTGLGSLKIAAGVAVGFAAGLVVALLPSLEAAPDQRTPVELEIAGETVRLGSAKSQLITTLSKGFALENSGKLVNGAEFWFVRVKGEPSTAIGSLQFKNDVLVTATREWAATDPDTKTMAFMRAMYGAAERVFGTGKLGLVQCTLKHAPGNEHLQIDLRSSGHSVIFAAVEATLPDGTPSRTAFIEESVAK